jgi:RNase P subunit RPR2
MNNVWGYKRLICGNCPEGNKNSKRKATYKVYETNSHLILICVKCQSKMIIEKKEKGKQIMVKRK